MNPFKVGDRVIGTRGMNSMRRMTIAEIRVICGNTIYVMADGPFLSADEIAAI